MAHGSHSSSLHQDVLLGHHHHHCLARFLLGGCWCLLLALTVNALRIALLAVGIAFPDLLPFNVMDPIPHTAIGLAMVAIVTIGLLIWTSGDSRRIRPGPFTAPQQELGSTFGGTLMPALFAVVFCVFAFVIHTIEPRPVDATSEMPAPQLPHYVAGFTARPVPLTGQELEYFAKYGGAAARAAYGPYGLLLVTTASPLRHLHDPSVCLGGMGFDVALIGTDHTTTSTLYRASRRTEHAHEHYLVRVSYQSDGGEMASSIAEVVWRWLRAPGSRWTMIQRIEPSRSSADRGARRWEAAIRRAFNFA